MTLFTQKCTGNLVEYRKNVQLKSTPTIQVPLIIYKEVGGDKIMNKKFLRWSKVPYAGESEPPGDPVTSAARSWSLTYLKETEKETFLLQRELKCSFQSYVQIKLTLRKN